MIKDRARGVPAVTRDEFAPDASPAPPEPQRQRRPEPQQPEPQRPVRNRIFRQLAVGALIGAAFLVGAPALAQASPAPATMTISSDVFPTGATLPGGLSGTVAVTGGTSVALSAPQYVYQPSNPPGTLGTVYEFMFWDVNSTLINTATADFAAPRNSTSFTRRHGTCLYAWCRPPAPAARPRRSRHGPFPSPTTRYCPARLSAQ